MVTQEQFNWTDYTLATSLYNRTHWWTPLYVLWFISPTSLNLLHPLRLSSTQPEGKMLWDSELWSCLCCPCVRFTQASSVYHWWKQTNGSCQPTLPISVVKLPLLKAVRPTFLIFSKWIVHPVIFWFSLTAERPCHTYSRRWIAQSVPRLWYNNTSRLNRVVACFLFW